MPKVLPKNSPVLIRFFELLATVTAVTRQLTKLFQMKVEAAEHHKSHRGENPEELFGQPSACSLIMPPPRHTQTCFQELRFSFLYT